MFFISHRGNINTHFSKHENDPSYVEDAIFRGFDCEVDVWLERDTFFLGHDFPAHAVNIEFLLNPKLWLHARNFAALTFLKRNNIGNVFWYDRDVYAMTSGGYIWTTSEQHLDDNCIVMANTRRQVDTLYDKSVAGICSSIIEHVAIVWSA